MESSKFSKTRRKGHKQRQILVIKRCKRSAVLAKQTINQLVQKAMLSNTKETLTVLPAKTDSDVVFCLQLHVYQVKHYLVHST